jgi:hypothetical protein
MVCGAHLQPTRSVAIMGGGELGKVGAVLRLVYLHAAVSRVIRQTKTSTYTLVSVSLTTTEKQRKRDDRSSDIFMSQGGGGFEEQ